MELPTPQSAVLALVSLVGDRLAAVGNSLGVHRSAPQVASVIVAAAPAFAPTPHARARLLRQLHASGLLADATLTSEARPSAGLLGVAP